jgi:CRP/FNR family transcriptional regulator, cyclic AMP receptor protein
MTAPIAPTEPSKHVPWQQNHLLKNLSAEQLAVLGEHIQTKSFRAGEVIFKEGDKGKRIYLIESGEVAVFREDERFLLNTLRPGESFGAMALLNNIPRSASVRTTHASELAYFTIGSLKKLAEGGQEAVYLQITKNHLYDLYEVVNKSDHQIIDSIKRELKASKARIAFASFFTTIVFLISLYVFMLRSSIGWISQLRSSTYVTSGMLLFTLGILLYMLKLNRYPIKYYGINLKNWRKSVPEALLWSLGFILFATVVKWAWYQFVPGHEGKSIWGLPGYDATDLCGALLTVCADPGVFRARRHSGNIAKISERTFGQIAFHSNRHPAFQRYTRTPGPCFRVHGHHPQHILGDHVCAAGFSAGGEHFPHPHRPVYHICAGVCITPASRSVRSFTFRYNF